MSNLKQIDLGFMQYTQDYDERLPLATAGPTGVGVPNGWMFYSALSNFNPTLGSVYPYIKSAQIFVCPSDGAASTSGDSYAINSCVSIDGNATGLSTARPAKSLAAFDETSKWMLLSEEGSPTNNSISTDDAYQSLGASNDFTARHLEGSNVAFLDGHVKWYRVDKIKSDGYAIGGTSPVVLGTTTCP